MSKRASASIRFTGEALDPDLVTPLIGEDPTLSYRKGDTFAAGNTGRPRIGLTGVWLLDLSERMPGAPMSAQVHSCLSLLTGERLREHRDSNLENIRTFLFNQSAKLDVSFYCFVPYGEKTYQLEPSAYELIERAGGRLHLDFDQETLEDIEHNKRAIA